MLEYFASCCTSREDEKKIQGARTKPVADEGPSTTSTRLSGGEGAGFALSGFATTNAGSIVDFYDVGINIGEGSFGSVTKAVKRDTNDQRAIKKIPKSTLKVDGSVDALKLFQKEVRIMSMMNHPHIVRLYETFEDSVYYHLVMEVCSGGELFDHIVKAGRFTEAQAAYCAEQIVRGVNYIHKAGIAHRDLKPENFLCLNDDPAEKGVIKIIDFGMATCLKEGQALTTRVGTPFYVAPEVLNGRYNERCDMWSCGVIFFVLLSGEVPFHGDTDAATLARVTKGKYKFAGSCWQRVSRDAMDLIEDLLVKDKKRLTAEKTLEHRWIRLKAPKATGAISDHGGLIDHMKRFQASNKFKKVALQVIANQMDDTSSNSLRNIFIELDNNGDGLLTISELKSGLDKAGLLDIPNAHELISSIDVDGTGNIDYTEFLSAALSPEHYEKEDILWSAFRRFDRDHSGNISREELLAVLDQEGVMPHSEIDKIFKDVDKDGDGSIDFEEFKAMMLRNPEA